MKRSLKFTFFILVSILLFALNSCYVKDKDYLSENEKEWLAQKEDKIEVLFGYASPPNVILDESGLRRGLLIDLINEMERYVGDIFIIKEFTAWADLMEYAQVNENYIIAGIARTDDRMKYFNFTNSFIKVPYVIITQKNKYYHSVEDLYDAICCTPESYAVNDFLKDNYPKLNKTHYRTPLECLRSVSSGTTDATIINQVFATYLIEKQGISNLHITGETPYINRLSVGVSKNNPVLFSIMDKTIDHIEPETHREIYRKWINVSDTQYSKNTFYIVLFIFFMAFVLLAIAWLIVWGLRKQVSSQTRQIKESESKYKALIENSNDAIYLRTGKQLEIVNKQFIKLFEYPDEELFADGFDISKLIAPEDRQRIQPYLIASFQKDKRPQKLEFKIITKSGNYKEISVSLSYILRGDVLSTQGVMRDVTIENEQARQLIFSRDKAEESDRLKSIFLANMSHEIRTPMNGILGFAKLLKKPNLSPSKQETFINVIEKSGKRMLSTINDLVNISKIEAGQVEVLLTDINIYELCENLNSFFKIEAEQKGLKLIFKVESSSVEKFVHSDADKIFAILSNLINNAIKYTPQGEIEYGFKIENNQLHAYVKDTGIGIAKERQKAIFDRFVQADLSITKGYEGSGLGLSISKAYVDMLGGDLSLISEIGKGTTFNFSLPANMEQLSFIKPDLEHNILNKGNFKNTTLLVAEDDEVTLSFFEELLEEECQKVYYAKNGQEAIDLCRTHEDINLVLLDIKMPYKNGYEAFHAIKIMRPSIPIIAQTAYALTSDIMKTMEAGFNDFISKPIDKEKLFFLIEKYSKN